MSNLCDHPRAWTAPIFAPVAPQEACTDDRRCHPIGLPRVPTATRASPRKDQASKTSIKEQKRKASTVGRVFIGTLQTRTFFAPDFLRTRSHQSLKRRTSGSSSNRGPQQLTAEPPACHFSCDGYEVPKQSCLDRRLRAGAQPRHRRPRHERGWFSAPGAAEPRRQAHPKR